jgi:hypothetical protein
MTLRYIYRLAMMLLLDQSNAIPIPELQAMIFSYFHPLEDDQLFDLLQTEIMHVPFVSQREWDRSMELKETIVRHMIHSGHRYTHLWHHTRVDGVLHCIDAPAKVLEASGYGAWYVNGDYIAASYHHDHDVRFSDKAVIEYRKTKPYSQVSKMDQGRVQACDCTDCTPCKVFKTKT